MVERLPRLVEQAEAIGERTLERSNGRSQAMPWIIAAGLGGLVLGLLL